MLFLLCHAGVPIRHTYSIYLCVAQHTYLSTGKKSLALQGSIYSFGVKQLV